MKRKLAFTTVVGVRPTHIRETEAPRTRGTPVTNSRCLAPDLCSSASIPCQTPTWAVAGLTSPGLATHNVIVVGQTPARGEAMTLQTLEGDGIMTTPLEVGHPPAIACPVI